MLEQGDRQDRCLIVNLNTNGEVILQVPAQTVAVHVVEGETSGVGFR